ncbi:MAG: DUF5005 domain-containing protein [Draconibacterium sp.]
MKQSNYLIKIKQMVFLGLILTMLVHCTEKDDGTNVRPNEFGEEGGTVLTFTYLSNADTVFFSWELVNQEIDFDHFQVSRVNSENSVEVSKNENSCFLTHIPYNELVPISIALMNNTEPVETINTSIEIDGLDTVFVSTFMPDRGSVTGGDGMYSIALPDGRSIFLMGDSYIGPVTNGARSMSDHMFRNTYILYDDGQVSAVYGAEGENSSAAVPPGVSDEHQKWYWPGHGFVQGDKLYIFQTLMYQGETGMWGFRYETTDILEYDLPTIALNKTTRIPFEGSRDIHYGMAALNDEDYIYIYAQKDVDNGWDPISDALVARTTINDLYAKWEYFDGSDWSSASDNAVKMQGLSSVPISSQFNVFKLNDKYVLFSQSKQFNSGEIYTFISDSPQGPWRNKQLVYKIPESDNPGLFTYNAMAHPQFRKDGMILISYNINNEDFVDQHNDVSSYRPRFLWIEIADILED